jgi:hypothetical protein
MTKSGHHRLAQSAERCRWYHVNIPVAEDRYERWLAGEYDEEV